MISKLVIRLISNPHTSSAGVVFLACWAIPQVVAIWFPTFAHQCQQTADFIQKLAIVYGLSMAGDAGAVPPKTLTPPPVESKPVSI